ncbi:riboflavin kinase [Mesobacillus foraminis]|uniref:riboflavin kinase n=1 Tax=Mesobacillus foraminis TaxID=279826 RepID=UPI00214CF5F5|nr:riboflavin kinase [Mesobacillus foraminis]
MNGSVHLMIQTNQSFVGTVVPGLKLGRNIGFPTANLEAIENSLDNGVYGVVVNIHEFFNLGVMNVGVKPTIGTNSRRSMEIHLLGFDGDLYGETLTYSPLFKIREERKFKSLDQLAQQIRKDVLSAERSFKHIGYNGA